MLGVKRGVRVSWQGKEVWVKVSAHQGEATRAERWENAPALTGATSGAGSSGLRRSSSGHARQVAASS